MTKIAQEVTDQVTDKIAKDVSKAIIQTVSNIGNIDVGEMNITISFKDLHIDVDSKKEV